MASDGLFAPLRDAALSAGRLHGGGISLVRVQPGRGGSGARGRLYRAGAGGAARIARLLEESGLPAGGLEIIDAPDDELESARAAAALARDGAVGMLMKGSLHSDHFMAAVVARESGLRTARRISHAFVMSVAAYPKLFILTDAAVNIAPTLAEKADIAQNAIDRRARWAWTGPRWRCCARQNR